MNLKKKLIIAAVAPFAAVGAMAISGLVLLAIDGPTETKTATTTTSAPKPAPKPAAPRISLEQRAAKVQSGMTLGQVQQIMGSAGKKEVTSSGMGMNLVTYTWGSFFATYVQVSFMNGEVFNVITM